MQRGLDCTALTPLGGFIVSATRNINETRVVGVIDHEVAPMAKGLATPVPLSAARMRPLCPFMIVIPMLCLQRA